MFKVSNYIGRIPQKLVYLVFNCFSYVFSYGCTVNNISARKEGGVRSSSQTPYGLFVFKIQGVLEVISSLVGSFFVCASCALLRYLAGTVAISLGGKASGFRQGSRPRNFKLWAVAHENSPGHILFRSSQRTSGTVQRRFYFHFPSKIQAGGGNDVQHDLLPVFFPKHKAGSQLFFRNNKSTYQRLPCLFYFLNHDRKSL